MAVERLGDGTFQAGDMNFPTSEQAFAYDALRSQGSATRPIESAPAPLPPPAAAASSGGMSKWWLLVIIPVGIFLLLLVIGFLSGPPDEKSRSRSAISLCWEEQKRKSLDPAMQRFIAGACEKMESDFRTKYNANP
jgi:hypothetical protein